VLLRLCHVAATVLALGETETSSAGEQLAEGYPSRAVTEVRRQSTDRREGRRRGLPDPLSNSRYCPPMPPKTPARRAEPCGKNFRKTVAIFSGTHTGLLLLLVEHFNGLAPRRLLAVVDLAQVQHLSLRRTPAAATTRFDDAPIAVQLAVLLP